MSDFIFSENPIIKGVLSKEVQSIYQSDKPSVEEFHGQWGSLAVSYNLYKGFQPYETSNYICITIGGPILEFEENNFTGNIGSGVILNRWIKGEMEWDEDISGPFSVLIVDKLKSEVFFITDLMSFIPIYSYKKNSETMLSTHVDILASVSNQKKNIDLVSKADFVMHGIVTYPYTTYSNIFQISPSSVHLFKKNSQSLTSEYYWLPREEIKYTNINETAKELRRGLQNYVNRITIDMSSMAQFISGGEDSRSIAALLPNNTERDAFVFLDHMNREGDRAAKAALSYGAKFNLVTRSKFHYLEIMSPTIDLIGDGNQFTHAHTYGFHRDCNLDGYSAVFGGLFADALLKGARIKKISKIARFPFLPQIKRTKYTPESISNQEIFYGVINKEIIERRKRHFNYISSFRTESAEEWFELWPSSMNMNIPNLHVNRRLFASYEPFMGKDIVKISSMIPQKWKLNRRLFQKTVKPLLKQTKWLLHGDGRLPYFPWYINSFIQFGIWGYQYSGEKIGLIRGNQGPWSQWKETLSSKEWDDEIDKFSEGFNSMSGIFVEKDLEKIFKGNTFTITQKINILQSLYSNQKNS